MQRPFLKWAGGKYRLLSLLKQVLPNANRLIEPFVGSGAVFLNTDYKNYYLADNNPDLINLYLFLQKEGARFIRYCARWFIQKNNDRQRFEEIRHQFNETNNLRLKSALFVYLNRHGYNGLCRYNGKGKFNVPFGCYQQPLFPEKAMIAFHKKSQTVQITLNHYSYSMREATSRDIIYCDPPYVPLSKTALFTQYSIEKFNEYDQLLLTKNAEEIARQGVTVVISNHDTEFTRKMYQNAKIISFDVQRNISCDSKNRRPSKELIAIFERTDSKIKLIK